MVRQPSAAIQFFLILAPFSTKKYVHCNLFRYKGFIDLFVKDKNIRIFFFCFRQQHFEITLIPNPYDLTDLGLFNFFRRFD